MDLVVLTLRTCRLVLTVLTGRTMVDMGHAKIRPVRYTPSSAASGEIELMSLGLMRRRAGLKEFVSPQRLDFDLLFRIDSGSTTHTVDFREYLLIPGDAVWVRAGQVQQWGAITDIEGPVLLFTPAALETRIHQQIAASVTMPPNYFPAAALPESAETGGALAQAFTLADGSQGDAGQGSGRQGNALRRLALAHAISVSLLLLASSSLDNKVQHRTQAHEAFNWFREDIDVNFRTRRTVEDYAARLGYSARTLNRLSRANTGLSAKQLIDERIVLEAKRALAHGGSSVAAVADEMGFDDPSNFSKYFRQRVGMAPAAFRNAAQGGQPVAGP